MGLLPLEKTWQKRVNDIFAAAPDVNGMRRTLLCKIVRAMLEFASNPWTVKCCSYYNGSSWTVDLTGTNQWLTQSNLGWGTGNRSWIVLHNTALNYDILIDCVNSNTGYITMKWSPGALFTASGTPSAPPTTSDTITVWNNILWLEYSTPLDSSIPVAVHVLHSTDGKHTRVFALGGGVKCTSFFFEWIDETPGTWEYPYVIWKDPYTPRALSPADFGSSSNYWMGKYGTTTFTAACGFESGYDTVSTATYTLVGMFNGNALRDNTTFPAQKMSLWSNTTNVRGRIGRLVDFWVASTGLSTNELFTESGSEFAIIGSAIVPWDGSGKLVTC